MYVEAKIWRMIRCKVSVAARAVSSKYVKDVSGVKYQNRKLYNNKDQYRAKDRVIGDQIISDCKLKKIIIISRISFVNW